jgi:hypothetical protein
MQDSVLQSNQSTEPGPPSVESADFKKASSLLIKTESSAPIAAQAPAAAKPQAYVVLLMLSRGPGANLRSDDQSEFSNYRRKLDCHNKAVASFPKNRLFCLGRNALMLYHVTCAGKRS